MSYKLISYKEILFQVDDQILTITLNRPDKLNAFTRIMMKEMMDAFDRADADDNIRAIIVTGAGRAFCAGADLGSGGNTFDADSRSDRESGLHPDGGGQLTLRIFECKKPVIAAINGPAVGIGITMTLAMDMRLAVDNAKIGFVFARRGIVPEACSSYFLPRIVGISQALEWCYSGQVFSAQEGLEGGLLRSVHSGDTLMTATNELARSFTDETSALSVTLIRQMMWRLLGADHPMEAHKMDSRGIYHMGRSADCREGVKSFLEKRAAIFPGKVSEDLPDIAPWWQDRTFS